VAPTLRNGGILMQTFTIPAAQQGGAFAEVKPPVFHELSGAGERLGSPA
jgi:hypothetical protein